MSKLIVASNNEGKIREIKAILSPYFDEILSLRDAGIVSEAEETGDTFYENALIKAKEVYGFSGGHVLADDSGLEVDFLNGGPGVWSARYAGEPCDDLANNLKLLEVMRDVPEEKRTARFVSCVVLYSGNDNDIKSGEGATEGRILHELTGSNGFGYDSVFFSFDLSRPFGLAAPEDKNRVSHRYRALMELVGKL